MACENPLILLVEDEVLVRMLLCEDLLNEGYEVADFPSGDAARYYLQTGGPCDLLLTDVRMPGQCDGLQLADWVEVHRPNAAIILMSSHLSPDQIGDRAFVAKPYEPAALINKVAELLAA